jgi:redox-sensitive bicupin YhaK (pirin superfamily)
LGISLADLVSQSVEQKMMEFDPDGGKVLWRGSSGGYARLIVGTSGADMVELWDWRLRPGDRYDAVAHSKGTREVIVVLRGRLGVSIGSSTASIASGRGLLATTDLAHSYWCEGARPVHFQMFVSERPDRGSL